MKVLSFQERFNFVEDVVNMCTVGDDYQPALFDVVFRLNILKYFADYDFCSEPQSEWSRIAYESFDLKIETEDLNCSVFWCQYESLITAVRERVQRSHNEFLSLAICNKRDAFAEFVDYLETYLDELKDKLGDFNVDQASQVMSALLDNKDAVATVLAESHKE